MKPSTTSPEVHLQKSLSLPLACWGATGRKLQQQLQNMEQEKQRKLLYLADLGKITRKKENIQCTLDEIFWKMSEVQRMCKTVQGATSTLVSDSSDSK